MKTIRTLLASALLSTLFPAVLPAQTFLTNGLVAYYPFNGNANDAMGTLHGTVVGAALTSDRLGTPNLAYSFNGTSSRIDFSSPPLTQITNWTLSAWVKPANFSQIGMAVTIGFDNNSSGNGYGFGLMGNSTWQGIFSGASFLSSGQTLPNPNQWYHMVMLRDASTTKFYINGLQTGNTYSTPPLVPTDFTIGSQNGVRFFNGSIDEVRVYNRAISSNEVVQLYASQEFCTPRTARATAVMTNGFIVGVSVTDVGCGYTNPPTVLIQGGGGSGATATAIMNGGQIAVINISSAGCCYTNSPIVVIESAPFIPTLEIAVSRVNVTQHVRVGRNYLIESSADLVNWFPAGTQFTAASENLVTEFVVSQTGQYFRIREVP